MVANACSSRSFNSCSDNWLQAFRALAAARSSTLGDRFSRRPRGRLVASMGLFTSLLCYTRFASARSFPPLLPRAASSSLIFTHSFFQYARTQEVRGLPVRLEARNADFSRLLLTHA